MRVIDFINDKEYEQKNDIKLAFISEDGTIYLADISNDGKRYGFSFPGRSRDSHILNYHMDYIYLFVHKYLEQNKELVDLANKANYNILSTLLSHNFVIFNNVTMYNNIQYTLHGTSGHLLINDETINKNQLESLYFLRHFLKDFNEINVNAISINEEHVREYTGYSGMGTTAIDEYLSGKGYEFNEASSNSRHNFN